MKEKIQLNKTNIKGLYLTNEGKYWHKSTKREIKPTLSKKIRFNGIVYKLNEIMPYRVERKAIKPQQPSRIKKVKKPIPIRELQKQGFKKTQVPSLYVSSSGVCYNSVSNKNLSITRQGNVIKDGKGYNLAKLILETFCKIPVKNGHINFKNGNDKDFSLENLEYKCTNKQPIPAPADIIKCIRFYYGVAENFNRNCLEYKFYLKEICDLRRFLIKHNTHKDFNLFSEWLAPLLLSDMQSKAGLSIKHGYSITNGTNIINNFLNLLIKECLQDFENGLLKIKDFKPKPPRKTSLKQKLNTY